MQLLSDTAEYPSTSWAYSDSPVCRKRISANSFLAKQIGTDPQIEPQTESGGGQNEEQRTVWLVGENIDLLFVCGLAPWIFGLLAYLIVGAPELSKPSIPQYELSVFFIVASLIIGEAHQFTSILKWAAEVGKVKRRWWQNLPLWAMFLGVAIEFLTPSSLSNELFGMPQVVVHVAGVIAIVFFPVVLMQHVCGQVQGIGMMYCGMNKFKLSRAQAMGLSLTSWLLVAQGAGTIAAPFVDFSSAIPHPEFIFVVLSTATATTAMLLTLSFMRRARRGDGKLPLPVALMWANLALYVMLPLNMTFYVWLFVPLFFHATQHWAVAWSARKRQVLQEGRAISSKFDVWKEVGRFVLPIQAATMLILFLPITLGAGPNAGLQTTLPLGWSMFVFYFHYFADRVVWRKS